MEVHGRAVNEVNKASKKLTDGGERVGKEGIEVMRRVVLRKVLR